jgi:hypothetical protein
VRQLAQDVHLVLQLVFHVIVLDGLLCYNFHRIVFVALPVFDFDDFPVRACVTRGYLCRETCLPRSRSASLVGPGLRSQSASRAKAQIPACLNASL